MKTKTVKISEKKQNGEGYHFLLQPTESNRHPRQMFIHAELGERVKPYPAILKALNPGDASEAYNLVIKMAWDQKMTVPEAFLIWKQLLIDYFGHCRYKTISSLRTCSNRTMRAKRNKNNATMLQITDDL